MTVHSIAQAASFGAPDIASTEEIIAEFRAGRMVILVDEEDRENEGDLILASEHVSPEAINFMVTHGRGLVCLTITEARSRQLGLSPMARDNRSPFNTAFTASIEAATGVTTGISTYDRARTIRAAIAKDAGPDDIVQPGHIFPITARAGGVLVRAGHTEAGCDLAQMAGLEPSAVLCEILKDDGTMARLPDLVQFARRHAMKIGTIADLIEFRSRNETLVERSLSRTVKLAHGEFTLHAYTDRVSNEVHLALTRGVISPEKETLVRVHEALSILDFLGADDGQCTFSLDCVLKAVARADAGVVVLLRCAGSGADLVDALAGAGAHPGAASCANRWDPRLHGIGAQILRDLGVRRMKLIASPRHLPSMTGFGLEVTRQIANPDELGDVERINGA
ncbi:MAG: 3,4-dihydroxy-2-butanone-4-phosphate synthase [Candidatus Accumulibacter sp.]|jgi:3,4-dihydroxy 2-butanone 4-phosphate synthase/GTP cyclohydrolase II|nr:3,4-dihydroxy-2-butanone-4-phosphate synthase [Accumulibacter sp.]